MGWSIGYDANWKRDIGYAVPAICDHPGCNVRIDRGLWYLCGRIPGGGKNCGLYFCKTHLSSNQSCRQCARKLLPFDPKPDCREWLEWKLTDSSWQQWREENAEEVIRIKQIIAKEIKLKSVLITGGTGYFGRGFVKRALEQNLFERICVLSRDEYKQSLMRTEFSDDPRLRFFIGDVRDKDRLSRAMFGVDLVIHAAALKRIEVGFYNPDEMIKTNVNGAMNVIDSAIDAGVKKVIGLSTDKAFEPISAYGQSKAIMESLFLAANNKRGADGTIFAVTRYGNVSGSTGSVIPTWRALINQGKKEVPVTDPDCTRYWMQLAQAVDLVLRTAEIMEGGELVIPELPAYRVGDLACAMNVSMQVKGMSRFEKQHESMAPGMSSDQASRMTISQLEAALLEV